MNDALLGMLLGGLIGIIPNLVTVFTNRSQIKSQQEHAYRMKYLEIFTKSKCAAIEDYMMNLGSLQSNTTSGEFSPDRFFASSKKACLYVSKDTRVLIREVDDLVHAVWVRKETHIILVQSPIVQELVDMVHTDLSDDFNQICHTENKSRQKDKMGNV